MTTLAARAERELLDVLAPYASGEAEVVRAYFAGPHTPAEYAELVRRQMGREIFCADWLPRAARLAPELEISVDRHAFVDLLEQIADETKHYALLADLAEWLLGHKLTAAEALEYRVYAVYDPEQPLERQYNPLLPEANAMLDLMRRFRAEHPPAFAHGVLRLTEGGGGGAFLEASKLDGDEFRQRFATAMGQIARDELGHGPGRVRAFAETEVPDEATLVLATRLLREYLQQHLRVRNEIYGCPLGPERLAAIDRGEVAPWAWPAAVLA